MPTQVKAEIIDSIQKDFKESSGIYFTNYKGLTVAEAGKLRDLFRENGIKYRVTKNTLTRIGAQKAGFENIEDMLNGQVSISYSKDDPSGPARVIKEYLKKGENLEVLGILFEGERFGPDQFDQLATLPTREELIAKFASALVQPMTMLASTLNGAMSKMVRTLDSLKNTKA